MGGVTPAPTKEEKTEGAGGTPGTLPEPPDIAQGSQMLPQLYQKKLNYYSSWKFITGKISFSTKSQLIMHCRHCIIHTIN